MQPLSGIKFGIHKRLCGEFDSESSGLVVAVATLKSQKDNLRELPSVRLLVDGPMIDIVRVDGRYSPREELWTGSSGECVVAECLQVDKSKVHRRN